MINGERIVAIIPARGGSKGLIGKNLAELGGHPLITWSILAAAQTSIIDRVITTSDDLDIIKSARLYGSEIYERPPELATDTVGVFEVITDLHNKLKSEGETARIYVVLEPTSPFRTTDLLQQCITPIAENLADSVSTFRTCKTSPHSAWSIEDGKAELVLQQGFAWKRRQERPEAYELSGEVYAFDINQIDKDTRSFFVNRAIPHLVDDIEGVDINTRVDLEVARAIFDTSPLVNLKVPQI